MTTPLPPLPETRVIGYYTSVQMQAYATAARADLEAEVKRLREALTTCKHEAGVAERVWKTARAALKETP